MKFCPHCGQELTPVEIEERARLKCVPCSFVHWNNPVPVAAGIIELNGQILLAQNSRWPAGRYRLITGYIEEGETPEQGMVRELGEEVGLSSESVSFVGHYHFEKKNELIVAFHVKASGTPRLNHEIAAIKLFDFNELEPWASCTGQALADWLAIRQRK